MNIRVLAVDDDPIVMELLVETLELGGYLNVTSIQDPQKALELVTKGETFDVIILDIQMPGLDGIELCQAIRAQRLLRFTPILMLTAMHDKQYVNRSFAAGADDYLNKPFDPFDVCVRIERAIAIAELKLDAERLRAVAGKEKTQIDPASLVLDGLASRATFENYLAQLSRCGATNSVVAIRVENFDALTLLNTLELEAVLQEVSSGISRRLEDVHKLLCYADHGVFLCVAQSSSTLFDGFLRSSIEDLVNSTDRLRSLKTKITLTFGEVARCRRFRSASVADTMQLALASLGTDLQFANLHEQPRRAAV